MTVYSKWKGFVHCFLSLSMMLISSLFFSDASSNKKEKSSAQPAPQAGAYGPYGNYNASGQGSYQYSGSQPQGQYNYQQYGQNEQYPYQNWQYPQGGYGGYNQWGSYGSGYSY